MILPIGALALLGLAMAVGTMQRDSTDAVTRDSTRFGYGRPATSSEIAGLDIDVRADGTGLPAGSGTPKAGAVIYAAKCSACHGPTGVEGPYDKLVTPDPGKGIPDPKAPRTVGNYWGYATTLYDFIHRAMPQTQPGSLTPDEVYAVVGWILWRNQLVRGGCGDGPRHASPGEHAGPVPLLQRPPSRQPDSVGLLDGWFAGPGRPNARRGPVPGCSPSYRFPAGR